MVRNEKGRQEGRELERLGKRTRERWTEEQRRELEERVRRVREMVQREREQR